MSNRDSADYVRIIKEPDSATFLYDVFEYYMDEKPKLVAKSTKVEPLIFHEGSISYYPSGKRKLVTNYQYNRPIGPEYEYYPNGILYVSRKYYKGALISGGSFRRYFNNNDGGSPINDSYSEFQIITSNDSTGKVLATDGNGYCVI